MITHKQIIERMCDQSFKDLTKNPTPTEELVGYGEIMRRFILNLSKEKEGQLIRVCSKDGRIVLSDGMLLEFVKSLVWRLEREPLPYNHSLTELSKILKRSVFKYSDPSSIDEYRYGAIALNTYLVLAHLHGLDSELKEFLLVLPDWFKEYLSRRAEQTRQIAGGFILESEQFNFLYSLAPK